MPLQVVAVLCYSPVNSCCFDDYDTLLKWKMILYSFSKVDWCLMWWADWRDGVDRWLNWYVGEEWGLMAACLLIRWCWVW